MIESLLSGAPCRGLGHVTGSFLCAAIDRRRVTAIVSWPLALFHEALAGTDCSYPIAVGPIRLLKVAFCPFCCCAGSYLCPDAAVEVRCETCVITVQFDTVQATVTVQ